MKTLTEGDYVLGTEDAEVERLGVQHLVWRPRATDAWRRAGFSTGKHLLDVGCGPGYATVDLAAIVGGAGTITAVDRSPRFLDRLSARARQLGLENITALHLDFDAQPLPKLQADGAWCRWVFAFLANPRQLLAGIARSVRPGATMVIHEYFNYASWRLVPRRPEFEEFVQTVMRSWRASGGEPDIALDLLSWLPQEGFRIEELRPIVDVVGPSNFLWKWPSTFVDVGVSRLADLGYFSAAKAARVKEIFRKAEASPESLVVTPAVLEIIARRI